MLRISFLRGVAEAGRTGTSRIHTPCRARPGGVRARRSSARHGGRGDVVARRASAPPPQVGGGERSERGRAVRVAGRARIREVRARAEREAEEKDDELRALVGSSYRDAIASADAIAEMERASAELTTVVAETCRRSARSPRRSRGGVRGPGLPPSADEDAADLDPTAAGSRVETSWTPRRRSGAPRGARSPGRRAPVPRRARRPRRPDGSHPRTRRRRPRRKHETRRTSSSPIAPPPRSRATNSSARSRSSGSRPRSSTPSARRSRAAQGTAAGAAAAADAATRSPASPPSASPAKTPRRSSSTREGPGSGPGYARRCLFRRATVEETRRRDDAARRDRSEPPRRKPRRRRCSCASASWAAKKRTNTLLRTNDPRRKDEDPSIARPILRSPRCSTFWTSLRRAGRARRRRWRSAASFDPRRRFGGGRFVVGSPP